MPRPQKNHAQLFRSPKKALHKAADQLALSRALDCSGGNLGCGNERCKNNSCCDDLLDPSTPGHVAGPASPKAPTSNSAIPQGNNSCQSHCSLRPSRQTSTSNCEERPSPNEAIAVWICLGILADEFRTHLRKRVVDKDLQIRNGKNQALSHLRRRQLYELVAQHSRRVPETVG